MEHHRGQWGSNLGFLLATVGAAVGLGNIWAFPYKMGATGGFPFLVVYLILAALIGFPIMISELAIGRKVGRSVLVSYQRLGGGAGAFVGWLAMLSPLLILSFYTVLGAYCIQYVVLNFSELIGVNQISHLSGAQSFADMLTNQPMAQPPAAPQSQTALPQKKKIPTGSRERSLRSPQPQRPNVVSEWARKRK